MSYPKDGSKEAFQKHQDRKFFAYLRRNRDATRTEVENEGHISAMYRNGGLTASKRAADVSEIYIRSKSQKRLPRPSEVEKDLIARMRKNNYLGAIDLNVQELKVVKKYGGMENFRKKVLGFSKKPKQDHIHDFVKRAH